jgi:hypothetical protein
MSEDRNGIEVTINEDWVRMLKTERTTQILDLIRFSDWSLPRWVR